MDEREKKEEQNKRIGWLTSVGVQLFLLILFYFIVAWREPFPPIPEYGIELGFTTSAGAPATTSPSQQAPQTEDVPVETQEEQNTSEPEQEVVESDEAVQEETVVSEVESPVKVEESKPEETKPVEEKEEVDSRAVMKPADTNSDETSDNPSEGKEEEKEVDQRAIYGSQDADTGDAEETSLKLSGWEWDKAPQPDDKSNQSGTIVFEITVDENGELRKIIQKKSTLTPAVARIYREAIEKLTFSQTADYKTAQFSTGTITFIIKSK